MAADQGGDRRKKTLTFGGEDDIRGLLRNEMMKTKIRNLKRVYEGVHAVRYGPGHFTRANLIGSLFFMGTE